MGWAWLVVHDRTESDAWRFDSASRDKGSDWVPALQMLWESATKILSENDSSSRDEYIQSMEKLSGDFRCREINFTIKSDYNPNRYGN